MSSLPRVPASPGPLVAVPACMKEVGGLPFHAVGDKYVRAVAEAAGAVPLMIPSLGEFFDPASLLAGLDGLLMTGSVSNVHPRHYGLAAHPAAEPHDEARDAVTLPLIRAALEQGLPLLCICRGFQELNVVLGGTLHARVHEVPGRLDHRSPGTGDHDRDYAPRHGVRLAPGSQLRRILGKDEIQVNSLHWQGIDRLAGGLVAEGVAPDGTIEAVAVKGARAFALGVQWHPEYKVLANPDSVLLFKAFGDAVRARREARGRSDAA
jgi:putative glutamine amidotransferase